MKQWILMDVQNSHICSLLKTFNMLFILFYLLQLFPYLKLFTIDNTAYPALQ